MHHGSSLLMLSAGGPSRRAIQPGHAESGRARWPDHGDRGSVGPLVHLGAEEVGLGMLGEPGQPRLRGEHCMGTVAAAGIVSDSVPPVHGQQRAAILERACRPVQHRPQVPIAEVVQQLGEHHQVEPARGPLRREHPLLHVDVAAVPQPPGGRRDRGRGHVAGQQAVTAAGELPGEDADRAARLESAAVALAGQHRQADRVLAPLVPPAGESPRVGRPGVHPVEVAGAERRGHWPRGRARQASGGQVAEVSGEALRRPPGPAGAGRHRYRRGPGDPHVARGRGPPGQLGVFAGRQRRPAAERQVGVAADAQVGAVHVRVAVAQLISSRPRRGGGPGPGRAGDDRAEHEVRPGPGLGQHPGEPAGRDLGVGVGAGQPQFTGPPRPGQRLAGPGPAGRAHVPGAGRDQLHPGRPAGDRRGLVQAPVKDEDHPGQDSRLPVQAARRGPDRRQAVADALLLVGGRHDHRHPADRGAAPPPSPAVNMDPSRARSRSAWCWRMYSSRSAARRACSSSNASGAGPSACPACRSACSAASATRPRRRRPAVRRRLRGPRRSQSARRRGQRPPHSRTAKCRWRRAACW